MIVNVGVPCKKIDRAGHEKLGESDKDVFFWVRIVILTH